MSQEQNKETSCGICHGKIIFTHDPTMNPIITDEYVACDNQHYFHRDCLKSWLKASENCPLCYTPFNPVIVNSFQDVLEQMENDAKVQAEYEEWLKKEEERKKKEAVQNLKKEINQTIKKGTKLYEQKKFKEAVNHYWDFLDSHDLDKKSNGYLMILFALSFVYYSMGKYGLAVQQLTQIVETDPSFPKAFKYLEMAYQRMGLPDKARWARERIENSRKVSHSDLMFSGMGASEQMKVRQKKHGSDLDTITSVIDSDNPFFAELKLEIADETDYQPVKKESYDEIPVPSAPAQPDTSISTEEVPSNDVIENQSDDSEELSFADSLDISFGDEMSASSGLDDDYSAPVESEEIPKTLSAPPSFEEFSAKQNKNADAITTPSSSAGSAPLSKPPQFDDFGVYLDDEFIEKCNNFGIDPQLSLKDIDSKVDELMFQRGEIEKMLDTASNALGNGEIEFDAYLAQEEQIKAHLDKFDNQFDLLQELRIKKL